MKTYVNFNAIEEKAASSIKYYAGIAAGIGACPVPGSDAVLLTGLQVKMVTDVLNKFGVSVGLGGLLKEVVGARVISMLGKAAVGNILKMIPGVGTGAGAAVNALVASSITYALGQLAVKAGRIIAENGWQGDEFMVLKTIRSVF